MRLSEVLSESAISVGVQGRSKWEIIEDLTDLLARSGQADASWRDTILAGLNERERQSSTGMQDGFAIPHCRLDEPVHKTLVSLAILSEGVDFDAIDGKRTHLVVCLVTPRKQNREHLRILAGIAQLFAMQSFREALLGAKTQQDALRIIRQQESGIA